MENVQSKSTRKKLSIIVFLCCAGYFVSYITRKNLNTAILPITKQTSFTETQLGTVAAALSITYGIGQIISGILADKFKPQNVVFAGLLLASVCNAVFPLFDSIVAFTIIWAINGFGQAMFVQIQNGMQPYFHGKSAGYRRIIPDGIADNRSS